MADPVTPPAEPQAPTEPQTPTPPKNDSVHNDEEAKALRKELEKAQMRANQLENEKAARDKEVDVARQKELEEKQEFKTLYEQQQAELKRIQDEREAEDRSKALSAATETMFKEYPTEVVELAKTAGLGLSDDSEAGKALLKEKLDAIKSKVAPTVTANNPYNPAPQNPDRQALVTKNAEGVSPMALAGAKGDDSVAMKYIGGLSAIEQMRQFAGYTRKTV